MLFKTLTVRRHLHDLTAICAPRAEPNLNSLLLAKHISSLKVVWRKDRDIDEAFDRDKRYKPCARVVKEVLNEPGQVIPLRYLKKRRERLRLKVKATTFLTQNPNLFDVYFDRIKPKTEPVRFIRPSDRLRRFIEEEQRIYSENESLVVSKLCKLLMMSKNRVLNAAKLVHVKRDFGFPKDLLTGLVPKYPEYFRLAGAGGEEKSFLELVTWNPSFAQSAIERRAESESEATGVRIRPNFLYKLPRGQVLKKEMREWVRDWLEMEYISPYDEGWKNLDRSSPEMEKRRVGVLHELLSLSTRKRVAVPILGKFGDEFSFSNEFWTAFTRHSGIFYLSLKGGIKTAVLREAYDGGRLADRSDPMLAIEDAFVELIEEGWRERDERDKRLREEKKKKKDSAVENQE